MRRRKKVTKVKGGKKIVFTHITINTHVTRALTNRGKKMIVYCAAYVFKLTEH